LDISVFYVEILYNKNILHLLVIVSMFVWVCTMLFCNLTKGLVNLEGVTCMCAYEAMKNVAKIEEKKTYFVWTG
jgi:hypothetical protein